MALSVAPAVKREIRLDLICLSLGNLVFIRRWYDLENLRALALDYHRGGPPPTEHVLLQATVIASVIVALVVRLAWAWAKGSGSPGFRRVAECMFLLALAYPLESIRRYWNSQASGFDWGSNISLLAIEAVLIGGALLRWNGNSRIVQAARTVTLAMSLLLPAVIADFGFGVSTAEPPTAFVDRPSLPMKPSGPKDTRFLWILFDELDQRLSFDARPSSVQLPELDRLRAESVLARQVEQTDRNTIMAIPSLLSGQQMSRVQEIDANTLLVTPEHSGETHSWRDQQNVFQRAGHLGRNAEVIGWYHPYCRVLGDEVARCMSAHWSAPWLQLESRTVDGGLWRSLGFLFQLQWELGVGLVRGDSMAGGLNAEQEASQRDQQEQYFHIRNRALESAQDPRIGLAYYHFPTPHPYPIYDRRKASFDLHPGLDYLDNMALVDRTVGELRKALEQSGLWDRTTILITADHGLRAAPPRGTVGWTEEIQSLMANGPTPHVPFLLKLAGEHQPVEVTEHFSAIVTSDLAIAVLSGEISTNAQAAAWLRSKAPLPLMTSSQHQ